jgi:uncharacterized protein YdhG (YjbR/CyaY superfamily)
MKLMKAYPGNATPLNFDHYVSLQPKEFRAGLIRMREIILSVVPQAEESISYQIPCFKYLYMLVGVGTNKNSCSFYTMSPPLVKQLKNELKDIKVSGATLHFSPNKPLPEDLIVKIVKTRMKQNESLAMSKNKK